MSDRIKQDDVNRAVWSACDTFRGTVSADIYKDYVLTMLFLKYISDSFHAKRFVSNEDQRFDNRRPLSRALNRVRSALSLIPFAVTGG